MIADIFGESGDEEEEEFTVSSQSVDPLKVCVQFFSSLFFLHLQGFNQEDLEGDKKEAKRQEQVEEESDSDEGVDRSGQE